MRERNGSVFKTTQGRWRVRWYTIDGRHPSRTFDTEAQARKFLDNAAADRRHGLDTPDTARRLKELTDEWWAVVENSVKPRTAERYLNHLRIIEQHLATERVSELTYQRLQRFVIDLQKEYRPRTVVNTYAVLSLVLKHGERLGLIRKQPPKPILPRITRPELTIPTKEQVEQLAIASQAHFHASVLLAGYGGLRQGEVLALSPADVHHDDGYILVHRARNKSTGAIESTKTDKARRVYMPDRLAICLRDHVDEGHGSNDLLFPATVSSFQKSWQRARLIAGLPGVRFHDLRHSAASLYIHAGWSVTQVADQLGHADPAMTLRTYSHLWPQSYKVAIEKIDQHLDH